MMIKYLKRREAQDAMKEWESLKNSDKINDEFQKQLGKEYKNLRDELKIQYEETNNEIEKIGRRKDYLTDVFFGVSLYRCLQEREWFSLKEAANDEFWMFLSLKVVPDLVQKRWDKDNEGKDLSSRFWSRSNRIWLKTIWWFVHYSLVDNDLAKTKELLSRPMFTTDTIMHLVERTGHGIYLYRMIILLYASLKEVNRSYTDIFKALMKLVTAKAVVYEPALYRNSYRGYVLSLLNDLGIDINKNIEL